MSEIRTFLTFCVFRFQTPYMSENSTFSSDFKHILTKSVSNLKFCFGFQTMCEIQTEYSEAVVKRPKRNVRFDEPTKIGSVWNSSVHLVRFV